MIVELHGLFVRAQQWQTSLCHAPEPLQTRIPDKLYAAVYLFGVAYLNLQKLTNRLNMNITYTDELVTRSIKTATKTYFELSAWDYF